MEKDAVSFQFEFNFHICLFFTESVQYISYGVLTDECEITDVVINKIEKLLKAKVIYVC